ncbi:hypothetical protein GJAV_G00259280 [Gymnothorax javanicus]|nr:hypothetical protein GJAV_G00259280 [Gymnothorax javanicus]
MLPFADPPPPQRHPAPSDLPYCRSSTTSLQPPPPPVSGLFGGFSSCCSEQCSCSESSRRVQAPKISDFKHVNSDCCLPAVLILSSLIYHQLISQPAEDGLPHNSQVPPEISSHWGVFFSPLFKAFSPYREFFACYLGIRD